MKKSSLNHIFRTIWSEVLNAWVAVSELVSKGKRSGSSALKKALIASATHASGSASGGFRIKTLALVLVYCFSSGAQANPIGAQVVNGTAAISQVGNTLNITNSPNAIINWQAFSINPNETTRFIQQSAASAVLNRVVGPDPSQLLGTLTSNGRVFLINPAGILVGQGARIDVAGFVASTLNLSDADFQAGKLNFVPNLNAGSIRNAGRITTPDGGTVYLVAPQVTNTGIITTPKGETILAAGDTVQLIDTGAPGVAVQVTGAANTATNLGQILADAGRIGMVGAVVKNSGTLNASSLVNQGGRIYLKASQSVTVAGTSNISATGATGGTIEVTGNQVALTGTATLDASGINGGGTILVGGDAHGANPNIQNAQNTLVDTGVTLKADATLNGDGGKVIVWSDNTTQFNGNISVQGGAQGGNGGWVEVSGKQKLSYTGLTNALAVRGGAGSLLLDPADFVIAATGGDMSGAVLSQQVMMANTTITTALTGATVGALNAGTLGDIYINDTVSWANANSLTFNAYGSIYLNSPVTAATGSIVLNAGGNALGTAVINESATGSLALSSLVANSPGGTTLSGANTLGGLDVQSAGVAGSGTLNVTAGTTTLAGALTAASLNISGGNLNFNGTYTGNAGSSINMAGGILNASTAISTPTLNWTGGTITGAGTLTVTTALNMPAGAGANVWNYTFLDGKVLNNNGVATFGSNQNFGGNGADLRLLNGATINNNGTWNINYANINSTGVNTFNNIGTLNVGSLGWGGTINAALNSTGTVNVVVDGLTLGNDMTGNGTFNSAAGTTVFANGASFSTGVLNLAGALQGTAALAVTNSFNQTTGILGNTFASLNITQAAGNLAVGTMGATGTVNLTALAGGITVNGAIAAGTVNVTTPAANSININGAVTAATGLINLTSGTVSQGAGSVVSAGYGLQVIADNISFGGTMLGACQSGGGCVGIQPFTPGRPIEIAGATANANALSITQADLAAINPVGSGITYGGWTVGNASSGAISFKGNFSDPGGMYTNLYGASVSQGPGTTISGSLATAVSGAVVLNEPTNQINVFTTNAVSPSSVSVVTNVPSLMLFSTVNAAGGFNITNSGGSIFVNGPTTTSALNLQSTTGIILGATSSLVASGAGDAIVLNAGTGNFINNAGAAALTAANGRWLVYSTNPALDTFGGLVSGNLPLWGSTYANTAPAAVAAGNRYLFSMIPSLTATVNGGVNMTKTYGTATVAPTTTITGLVNAATYGNVFTQEAITGTGLATSAGFAANAHVANGPYVVTTDVVAPAGYGPTVFNDVSLTVTPATLTATLSNVGVTKAYDGTMAAPAGFIPTYTITGLLAGDTATLTNTGALYNNVHVVGATTLTVSGLAIGGITGANASAASDYTFNGVTSLSTAANITPLALTSTATATIGGVFTKVYDGTATATGATLTAGGAITGIAGDVITLDTAPVTLNYNSSHVATANTISATGAAGFTIVSSPALSVASDYTFTPPVIAPVAGASITQALLTSTAAIGGTLSKIFDGTTAATGATLAGTVTGGIVGDTLTLNFAPVTLAYSTTAVGPSTIVATGAPTLTITSPTALSVASDYSFTAPAIATVVSTINAAPVVAAAPAPVAPVIQQAVANTTTATTSATTAATTTTTTTAAAPVAIDTTTIVGTTTTVPTTATGATMAGPAGGTIGGTAGTFGGTSVVVDTTPMPADTAQASAATPATGSSATGSSSTSGTSNTDSSASGSSGSGNSGTADKGNAAKKDDKSNDDKGKNKLIVKPEKCDT